MSFCSFSYAFLSHNAYEAFFPINCIVKVANVPHRSKRELDSEGVD